MGRGRGWKILTVLLHTFFAGPSLEEGQGDPEDDPGRKEGVTHKNLSRFYGPDPKRKKMKTRRSKKRLTTSHCLTGSHSYIRSISAAAALLRCVKARMDY